MRIFKQARGPDTGLRAYNSHYTRVTPWGDVVQAWPKGHQSKFPAWTFYKRTEFAYAAYWAANSEPMAYQTAVHLSKGTDLLPRDILVMAMYATLYEFIGPDGTVLQRVRDVAVNPQLVLDLVTQTPGAMLWRSPVGWVELPPGNSGQVLAIINATPEWQDVYPIAIANNSFLTHASDPTLPNARVVQDTTSIVAGWSTPNEVGFKRAALTGDVTASLDSNAMTIANRAVSYAKIQAVSTTSRLLGRATAGAGDVEELTLTQALDFVGSAAQGDLLFRGSSGWTRLPAGTPNNVLQTNGTGADPSWVTAGGGGGGGGPLLIGQAQLQPTLGTTYGPNQIHGGAGILKASVSVNAVQFWCRTANASVQLTPAIYDTNSAGGANTLLATGPTVTGASFGLNNIPLTAPLSLGADGFVWCGLLIMVSAVASCSFQGLVWGTGAVTVPNPAVGFGVAFNAGAMPCWLV